MTNSKHEIRNPKQYRNSNLKCSKHVFNFGHLELEFVSSFDIRISDLKVVFRETKPLAKLCNLSLGRNTRESDIRDGEQKGYVFA